MSDDLTRLYLACDAERDAAVKELDVCLADLTASEEKRRMLVEQVSALVEENQTLRLQLAVAQGR